MLLIDWIKEKILKTTGMTQLETSPNELAERLTLVNDKAEMVKQRIREYNRWYEGDSDSLLDFYTRSNMINYHYEPFYARNKRNYFWAISSTEEDIKRVHSGQAKNIVDTICAIIGRPDVSAGNKEMGTSNPVDKNLNKIIQDNNFWDMYTSEQMPMTLVEGWGCYKIDWDLDLTDEPIIIYYRAENVDFIKKKGRIIGVIFKEYYSNGKKTYLITETRRIQNKSLIIEKEIFDVANSDTDYVKKIAFSDLKEFEGTPEAAGETRYVIPNFNKLLAVPCVFYKDTTGDCEGRSILAGKIDLLDDLDQCLSQSSSAIRKSTPIEYIDENFLERDPSTGVPIQPKAYDRKFIGYRGAKDENGSIINTTPALVTQPTLNVEQYSSREISILLQIINGILSPATLGIDLAKRDNAEAEREKEKITIFTRKWISEIEGRVLKELFSQCLCVKEYLLKGEITTREYQIDVTYPEFANESYENLITILGEQLEKGNISYDMYLSKLYNGKLSDAEYKREKNHLIKMHEPENEGGFIDETGIQEDNSEDFGTPSNFEEQGIF